MASVVVTPDSADLISGDSLQLSAIARDEQGQPLSGKQVTWSSNAVAVATVSSTGLARAVTPGRATITATIESRSGSAQVMVQSPQVGTVEVAPPSASLNLREDTLQVTATVKDQRGQVMSGKTVTWTSANPAVATVSADGNVIGIAVGSAAITATVDGKSGSTTITVSDPGPRVTVEPATAVSKSIGPSGGTVTTASSAGIQYTLEIPAGALTAPKQITMTPVTNIRKLGLSGGLLGAVQLQPSGLKFLRPAELSIRGFASPSGGLVPVGFVAVDAGGLQGLVPVTPNGALIVPHFSIVGAGAELPAALTGLVPSNPSNSSQGFMSQLSAALVAGASRAAIVNILASWGAAIRPIMVASSNDDSSLLNAISEYALWDAAIQFASQARPDLAGIRLDEPLSSEDITVTLALVEGLARGIVSACIKSRTQQSLEATELALFWQEQAEGLDLENASPPVSGMANLRRATVLAYVRDKCLDPVVEDFLLIDPMTVGTAHPLTALIKVQYQDDNFTLGIPIRRVQRRHRALSGAGYGASGGTH